MKMKRVVSFLLVLMLLIGMFPSAFAAEVGMPDSTIVTEPEEDAADPPGTTVPTEAATEVPTEAPATVPSEAPTELPTETPTEAPTEVPTEPVKQYTKMEAETEANIHCFADPRLAIEGASNGYVVGGAQIEDVFQLELFEDLASSSLLYTPYVKFNITAAAAGEYELHVGVAVENIEDPDSFYIPVVVGDKAYKATCEDLDAEDGLYEFEVTVELAEGKNEIYCIAFDADLYLELIQYDVSALSDAAVNFDYLAIPEGVTALEKDVEPAEETTDPTESDGTEATEPEDNTPDTLPEGGVEEVEPTDPGADPSGEAADPSGEAPGGTAADDNGGISLYGDSHGSDVTDGASGGTPQTPGGSTDTGSYSGQLYYTSPGVTVQVVLFPYGESYNRNNSYDNVINTIQGYTALDACAGKTGTTVYDGLSLTANTFMADTGSGRVYRIPNLNINTKLGSMIPGYGAGKGAAGGYQVNPALYDCVTSEITGVSASVTNNSDGTKTITMPRMGEVEAFLKQIIYGSSFGYWDKTDVCKNASGADATSIADDVSQFANVLRFLGCPDEYIQNYIDGYTGKLSITEDANVMIPTIIWSYVIVECSQNAAGVGYGLNYINAQTPNYTYTYKDEDAYCCSEHGTMSGQQFVAHNEIQLNLQVYTVGDIVYTSILQNHRYSANKETLSENSFNSWWKTSYAVGIGGQSPTTIGYREYVASGGTNTDVAGGCYFPAEFSYCPAIYS